MPRPLQIFSQSDYLIQIFYINSNTEWQTVQIQISWLLRSQLIWIYTVCKDNVYPGSAGLGLKREHSKVIHVLNLKHQGKLQQKTFCVFFIPRHTIVAGYYGFTFDVRVSNRPSFFCFRMITWVNINRFSPKLVCALILWISGLGLLMGKFRQTFTELSARDTPIFSFPGDNLSK